MLVRKVIYWERSREELSSDRMSADIGTLPVLEMSAMEKLSRRGAITQTFTVCRCRPSELESERASGLSCVIDRTRPSPGFSLKSPSFVCPILGAVLSGGF